MRSSFKKTVFYNQPHTQERLIIYEYLLHFEHDKQHCINFLVLPPPLINDISPPPIKDAYTSNYINKHLAKFSLISEFFVGLDWLLY